MEKLIQQLKDDENYRASWEANIAKAFNDEIYNHEKSKRDSVGQGMVLGTQTYCLFGQEVFKIANSAASKFIDSLINSK